jgi:transposase InsO family protein
VRRVASALARADFSLEAVITDNGSEYRAHTVADTLAQRSVQQRRIRAGHPQMNGHFERLQQTILEECWLPSFARSLVPKLTALERDLKQYLGYYRFGRTHTGRLDARQDPGRNRPRCPQR